jgi:VIT1/CCC1 family predicted Fe2+/Mn2+ transporter
MKDSIKRGFSFGLTSGVITTLGLIIGLYAVAESKSIVLGGILIIALADALSDSMGIHISEESKSKDKKKIWSATISTFVSKLFCALTFLVPILVFELGLAVIISIVWGFVLIAGLSIYISKRERWKVIVEHVVLTIFVIFATYGIGRFVRAFIY